MRLKGPNGSPIREDVDPRRPATGADVDSLRRAEGSLALNKRKILEAARKQSQKGAKAKALKEYNKLLQEDPRDAKLLLEVGDAYRRWGQNDEAIVQYGKVAQQYRQDGFDARAVAVFKQILNLDSKNYAAYVSLSELYQRMGLDSEAVAALQTAADGYHKEGRKSEALDLLRQMAALDPTNTTSRLKVAELLKKEGMKSEAVAEYQAVIAELENQLDRDQLITVLERLLEIKADDIDGLTKLVRQLMESGEFQRAEPLAVRALDVNADAPQFELLMDLYAQMGDDAKLADTTRGLAKLYRDRGDEERAREMMQRLPSENMATTSSSRLAVDVSEVDAPDLGDEELLDDDDDAFLSLDEESDSPIAGDSQAGSLESNLGSDGPALDLVADTEEVNELALDDAAAEVEEEASLPEGDPDQLLAEASVYLRYGKGDQAIASLRGILAQEPEHRAALEKLGEAYVDDGQNSEAIRVWLRAADQMRVSGDAEALSVLKDRIATLDPAMAEQIGEIDLSAGAAPEPSNAAAAVSVDPPMELDLDLDLEVDLDLDQAMDDVVANETQAGLDFGTETDDFEIELDDDSVTFDAPPVTAPTDPSEASATAEEGLEVASDDAMGLNADEEEFEIEVELDPLSLDAAPEESIGAELEISVDVDMGEAVELGDDVSVELDLDAGAVTGPPTASAGGQSTTTTAKINEELEEAEFYIAQTMHDEAEALLQRILDVYPNHPAALLRMGEVVAARGGEPDDAVSQTNTGGDAPPAFDFETTARFDDDDEEADEVEGLPVDGEVSCDDDTDDEGFEIEVDIDVDDVVADEDTTETNITAEASEAPLKMSAEVTTDLSLNEESAGEVTAESSIEAAVAEVAEDAPSTVAVSEDESADEIVADPDQEAAEAEAEPAVEEAIAAEAEPMDAGESFDLREALSDVLGDATESEDSNEVSGVLSTVEDGFESIFSDFKKGVTATLDKGDFDTRYDLGIAYREMGLYEDAIGEFRICLDSETRRFDSLYLMGICARDLGRFDDSVSHLEQALALPDLPDERMAGVYFDLSIAEELTDKFDRACASLRRVIELEPNFPGAADRLAALESNEVSSPQLGEPGEVFESFDDLFEEDDDDEGGDVGVAAAASVETYESFDDVMSEAEAALDEADLVSDASAEEETSSSNDDKKKTPPRKGGRKKISFV